MLVPFRFGLRAKAISFCILLVLGTVCVLGTALLSQNYADSIEQLSQQALGHAHVVSQLAEPAVLLNDSESLAHICRTAAGESTALSVLITDDAGRELAFSQRSNQRGTETHNDIHTVSDHDHEHQGMEIMGEQLLVTVPIVRLRERVELDLLTEETEAESQEEVLIGYVAILHSLTNLHEKLTQRIISSVLICLAIGGIALLIVIWKVQSLLGPVRDLVATTAGIAAGDLGRRASEDASDEIGELARAFNNMADRLEASYASIERKVAERTSELEEKTSQLQVEVMEREMAEVQLRHSQKKIALHFQQTPLGVIEWDTNFRIGAWNPGAERIFGFSEAEALGKHASTIVPDTLRKGVDEIFAELMHGQGGRRCCNQNQRKDGTRILCDWYNTPLVDDDGEIFGIASMVEDITDRVHAQEELERAKEDAEAANKAKSEFLANMSHEIRTPMTAILGYTEVLLDQGDLQFAPRERIEAVHTIKRNGEHLIHIINDILDLSKIEAGKLKVERVRCSLLKLMEEAESLMQVRADAKGLSLGVEYRWPLPETVETDPTRLRQILLNIIGNAIKFTETGGVKLEVVFLSEDREQGRPNAQVQIDVVDSGIGMTQPQAHKLFQPFTQGDTSTVRKFGGTGLGLAISKRLAEILGGNIIVAHTAPEKGTRFRITIGAGPMQNVRFISELPQQIKTGKSSETQVDEAPLKGTNANILLAEDGPDNQRLISHFLTKAGAKVSLAENGRMAVDMVMAAEEKGCPFDAVIMDMQMPVLDGYGATKELRIRGYRRPIIALTAHSMAGDRDKCISAGCDDYATKPIDRVELCNTIRKQLDKHAALTASEAAP